ncbi:hypothetical protein QWY79_15505, partial [Halomonas sabkhae]|nr:hypothetical protein [Halomonas sabkhae]
MGRRLTTRAPDGQRWAYHHDAYGRLAGITHPDGSAERLTHDEHGRVVQHTDATGGKTHYRYDARERLERLTLPDGGAYHFQYDAHDRLIAQTDPQGVTQRFAYDRADQLVQQQHGQQLTRLEHDALGRLRARHLPATAHAPASTEHYQWRADGQLAAIRNPISEVHFEHDAAGRVVGEQQHHLADPERGIAAWQW